MLIYVANIGQDCTGWSVIEESFDAQTGERLGAIEILQNVSRETAEGYADLMNEPYRSA